MLSASSSLFLSAILATIITVGCQKLSSPICSETDTASIVCNAVLHYSDKVIDQGQYCNGCANCSGVRVPLGAENSFVWQHFEHPDLRVQFLKCGPLPPRQRCGANSGEDKEVAAVFVTERHRWNPRLHSLNCICPRVNEVPLYQLRSWSLQDSDQLWVYEFTCPTQHCQVPQDDQQSASKAAQLLRSPKKAPESVVSFGAVCAEKQQLVRNGPVAVTFKCTCPPGYNCMIKDVVLKSDESLSQPEDGKQGGGGGRDRGGGGGSRAGGGSGGEDGDWRPLVVKHCRRFVMAGENTTGDRH